MGPDNSTRKKPVFRVRVVSMYPNTNTNTKNTKFPCPDTKHEHEKHEIFVFRHENFSCSKIKFSCLDTKIKNKTRLDTNGHDINTKFFYIKIFKLQFLSLFFDTLAPKYYFFFIFEFNSLLLKTI